jgi:threonine/homoserine/homoserine lactone efflux protein
VAEGFSLQLLSGFSPGLADLSILSILGIEEFAAMSVSLSTLAIFSIAALALMLTPGPDMLFCLSRSIGQGRQAAFASLFGILTGLYIWAIAGAVGLTGLIALVPGAFHVLRIAGACYLAYLAWQAFRSQDVLMFGDQVAPQRIWTLYRQGLMSNLLNPKVALFFAALFPQFVDPEHGSIILQSLILAAVLNAFGLLVNGAIILVASRFALWLRARPGMARAQRWFMGTVFGGLALRLAFDTQK